MAANKMIKAIKNNLFTVYSFPKSSEDASRSELAS
jgi:hypothetical protein